MKAVIELDVPEWQINQNVAVYFPDTMMKHGVCKPEKRYIMDEKDNGMTAFGVWLSYMLKEYRISQTDFAKIMNVSRCTVHRWIHEDGGPTIKVMNKILGYFKCHMTIIPDSNVF